MNTQEVIDKINSSGHIWVKLLVAKKPFHVNDVGVIDMCPISEESEDVKIFEIYIEGNPESRRCFASAEEFKVIEAPTETNSSKP